jgi:hypothetical protein
LQAPTDSAAFSVAIYDSEGKKVKTLSTKPKDKEGKIECKPGMNRVIWDMQYEPSEKIDGMVLWNGNAGSPKAAPGEYKAVVKLDNDSVSAPIIIKGDPNYKISDEEYKDKVNFLLTVRNRFNDIQITIKNIRSLRNQVNELTAKTDTNNVKAIKQIADTIVKRLTTIEEALYQTKAKAGQDILNYPMRLNDRMSALYNVASSGSNAPTAQVKQAYTELNTEVTTQLDKYKQIITTEVAELNRIIFSKQIPVIGVKQ